MKKIPLFFNPTAKSARAANFRRWSKNHDDILHHIEPSSANEMVEMLKEEAKKNTPVVAIAGGDGTLCHAAAALQGTETRLGIFPAGTVNVFSKEIGLNGSYNQALKAITQKQNKPIDLFCFNGIPFIQMAGIGPDARAVELTTWEMKKRFSVLSYGISALKMIRETQPQLTLTTDEGKTYQGNAILCGNGRKYAGPFTLFRHAQIDDGLLDVIIYKGPISTIAHTLLNHFIKGGATEPDGFHYEYIQIKEAHIKSNISAPFELDGDHRGSSPIHISKTAPVHIIVP